MWSVVIVAQRTGQATECWLKKERDCVGTREEVCPPSHLCFYYGLHTSTDCQVFILFYGFKIFWSLLYLV